MNTPALVPSPELQAILRDWVKIQEEKYGSGWKTILAKEMTAKVLDDPIMSKLVTKLCEEKK
jgi:hypothetical protein